MITHRVADYDAWKGAFDAHQQARKAASVSGHHLNRGEDDPNTVTVWLPVTDVEAAREFAASDELKTAMHEAGITSAPEVAWMEPLRMVMVSDRPLPSMILSHSVADVPAWIEAYDGSAELQTSNGIIGHAANRSLDDGSMVYVYHQAEPFDTLRRFLENPDLKAAMEAAGVTSAPQVTFVTGGPFVVY
jgi:hypothetical protein